MDEGRVNWTGLASLLGPELDELMENGEYDCAACSHASGQHHHTCAIAFLQSIRRKMVPSLREEGRDDE